MRSTTNRHLSMSGLSLSSVEALKDVSVLPLPVVCQI
ncbi:secreted protein [methanotrophic bacterial endosymbiont of Bathymodiolus sp.]|nr:secreted protein [methanotrophic bacterial endosymbiont of Bathymodiolus sp.]